MQMSVQRVLWTKTINWSQVPDLLKDPLKLVKQLGVGVDTSDPRNISIEFKYHLKDKVTAHDILLEGVTGIDVITARIFKLPVKAESPRPGVKLEPKMTQEIRLDTHHKAAFVHYHPDAQNMVESTLGHLQNPGALARVLQEKINEFKIIVDGKAAVKGAGVKLKSGGLKMFRYEWAGLCPPCCQVQGTFASLAGASDSFNVSLDWALCSCYNYPPPTSPTQAASPDA